MPTIVDIPPIPAEPQVAAPSALEPGFVEEAAKRIFGRSM